MGSFLNPGHTYVDGSTVTGPNLTEHVAEATFKPTAISDQTLRTPATLTDQILVAASGILYQETLQQIHDLILYPGCVVQTKYAEYTANTNLTAIIPQDDTIPQNTEGTEIIPLSITPRFATSTIMCTYRGDISPATALWMAGALFRDSVANAIASTFIYQATAGGASVMAMAFNDSPATTSATTYRIRVGPSSAGTVRMNGPSSTRYGGGTSRATLILQEIKV